MDEIADIFPFLSQEDIARLHAVSEQRSFSPGTLLLAEGALAGGLYLLIDGVVSVAKRVGAEDIVVAELCGGEIVGEISFADGGPASATVRAATDVTALVLAKDTVHDLVEASPTLGMHLYQSLAATLSLRLRQMTEQYMAKLPS